MIETTTVTLVMFGWELSDDFIEKLPTHIDHWNQTGLKGGKKRKTVVR
jgi:hypothetical protein